MTMPEFRTVTCRRPERVGLSRHDRATASDPRWTQQAPAADTRQRRCPHCSLPLAWSAVVCAKGHDTLRGPR
jgi:hypothetical protein